MRLIKMFGLAVIAAIASMAFIGASSASAESAVLCSKHEDPCAAANKLEHTHVLGTSTNALLLAGSTEIECESEILGTALLLGSPLVGHISLLDFTECNGTVNVIDGVGLMNVLKTALNLGVASAEGFEVLTERFGVHCVYGGVANELHVLGSASPTTLASVVANQVVLKKLSGNVFCPSTSKWDATYTIQLPDPVFISS